MIFSLPLTAMSLFSYIFSLDSAEVSVDVVPLIVVKSLYFFIPNIGFGRHQGQTIPNFLNIIAQLLAYWTRYVAGLCI